MPEYDGQYEVTINYSVLISSLTLQHTHSFDVRQHLEIEPGEVFEDIGLKDKSGLTVLMGTFIQDYLDVWTPLLGTGTTIDEISLWKYDPEPSLTKIFIASADGTQTTSFSGSNSAAQGSIYTFRSQGYKFPTKMYVMEPNSTGETRQTGAGITGGALAYMNYCISDASCIVGRNGQYLIAKIAHNRGQNEALRDLRFRGGV